MVNAFEIKLTEKRLLFYLPNIMSDWQLFINTKPYISWDERYKDKCTFRRPAIDGYLVNNSSTSFLKTKTIYLRNKILS